MTASLSPNEPACWAKLKETRLSDLRCDTVLNTGTREQRANLLSQLDSDRRALLAVTSDIAHLRNACTPILSTLPAELFIRIVALVAEAAPAVWTSSYGGKYDPDEKRSPGWTAITRVCKQWRMLCHGTPQLWPLPASSLSTKTSFHTNTPSRDTIFPFPYLLPCLQELSLKDLRALRIEETLNLLSRAPLLRVLLIEGCTWSHRDAPELSSLVLNMEHLRSLTLRGTFAGVFGGFDNTPLEVIYEHLRFPPCTNVELSPEIAHIGPLVLDSESSIRFLQRVFKRTFGELYPSTHPMGLRVNKGSHMDDSHSGFALTFSVLPAGSDIYTDHYFTRHELRRATIYIKVPLATVFADPIISRFVQHTVSMLMIETKGGSHEAAEVHRTLFSAFPHIKVLRVATSNAAFILSQLAPDVANHLPCLQELQLSFALSSSTGQWIIQILKKRAVYPAKAIKTLRLSDVRPPAEGNKGAMASELERIVPIVIWKQDRER